MKIALKVDGPGMMLLNAQLRVMDRSDVLVGIPAGNNERRSGEIGNAELLFIFSNGSPMRGQPPRPVLEPAIEQAQTRERIVKELAASMTSALTSKNTEMLEHLDKAGTIAESAAKKWFTSSENGWKGNAPSTIQSKGSDTPGIDTGQMRRAITHVVESGEASNANA